MKSIFSTKILVANVIHRQEKLELVEEMPDSRARAGNVEEPRASCSAKK